MRLVPAILVCAAVLAFGADGSPSGPFAHAASEPPTERAAEPVKADRDGNKLFDDLEARLRAVAPSDELAVIVTLDAPATPNRVAALASSVGPVEVKDRFVVIDGFAATATAREVRSLATLPLVSHVELDSTVRAANDSAQRWFGVTKARLDAGADGDRDGEAESYSPDDLVAAVIDTGIDPHHADLDGGKVLAFKDFVNGRAEPYDDSVIGHGTHVAATLAGEGDARADRLYRGVAPAAALVGVKILDRNGSGSTSDLVAALGWVVANKEAYGIEAVNLSLATLGGCADGTDAASLAADRAADAGLVVVAAAGNTGPNLCTIGSPAAAAKALAVGAMADLERGGFRGHDASSRGPTADGRIKPDVVAPGVGITSAGAGTLDGYAALTGTSMAAPFAAGVALLMLDVSPDLSPLQVKEAIVASAVDWGSAGADVDYGAGRLDAYAALAVAGAGIAAPPALPSHEVHVGTLGGARAHADYTLEVVDTRFPVAATLIAGSPTGTGTDLDFDLVLLDPSGAEVASAQTESRQEELGLSPVGPGAYTVRIVSAEGAGDYVLDISAGLVAHPPDSVAPPTVAGDPRQGATLTVADGTWEGTPPLAFAYRWLLCNAAGSGCADVPGARGSTITLGEHEVGRTLRVRLTASNGAGSKTVDSEPTAVVAAFAEPVNVGRPLISGTAQVGQVLAVANGVWTGTPPLVFAYRWRRCDSAGLDCSDVSGAEAATFAPEPADVGRRLRVVVRASNSAGSSTATSEATPAVAWPPQAGAGDGDAGNAEATPTPAAPLEIAPVLPSPSPPSIVTVRAVGRRHAVYVRVRVADCERCAVRVRLRVRGAWRVTRLRSLRRDLFIATLRRVPSGRQVYYVSVEDGLTGLGAWTGWRRVRVR